MSAQKRAPDGLLWNRQRPIFLRYLLMLTAFSSVWRNAARIFLITTSFALISSATVRTGAAAAWRPADVTVLAPWICIYICQSGTTTKKNIRQARAAFIHREEKIVVRYIENPRLETLY